MTKPLIIAVVSGKGGVGKTMLSVAIANELAQGRKTLLLDLDFFNRGLTGLFASAAAKVRREQVRPPELFTGCQPAGDWYLVAVGANLFTVEYGDIEKSSAAALEAMDVQALSNALGTFIMCLCEQSGCEIAVLDCHGGPDNTSFAACAIATHSILVSEPDKITLYGTLNFVRQMAAELPDKKPDIRLVFNKVIPAFSARFLQKFYDDLLRDQFGGNDLLAIYPFEPHLTKGFEKTPFLTTVYPTSQLAIKTNFLLHDLLAARDASYLPPKAMRVGRVGSLISRYYMGRWPRILDQNFIFRLIGFAAIGLVARTYREQNLLSGMLDSAQFFFITAILVLWLFVAAILNWLKDLDIFLTYSLRSGSYWVAAVGCVTLAMLCLGGTAIAGSSGYLSNLYGVLLILPLYLYARRGWLNIKDDRRYLEGGFRMALTAAATATFGITAFST
ncbi:ParA family protein [Acidisphaera sp. S103]|uniref:ParA family protein n=1 Tax=Acidisphaera sp. S103 TaxID=1747223 RepID=UPI00131B5D16|nr:ParA family protein [Acidisphaera sp. S103]